MEGNGRGGCHHIKKKNTVNIYVTLDNILPLRTTQITHTYIYIYNELNISWVCIGLTPSFSFSMRTFFRATILLVLRSRALNTSLQKYQSLS